MSVVLKIFVSLFCLCLIGSLFYQLSQKQDKIEKTQKTQYEIGYNMGYSTAVAQFIDDPELKVISNINQKHITYTVDSKVISDEAIQGYEDGYHKAVESVYCTR